MGKSCISRHYLKALSTWEQLSSRSDTERLNIRAHPHTCKQMDLELQRPFSLSEKDWMLKIHHNKGREDLCHTASWKKKTEDLLQNYTQLLILQKSCPRGKDTFVWKRWRKNKGEEIGHLIEIQDLFGLSPDTQEESQLIVLEGAAGIGKSTLARQVKRAWGDRKSVV